MLQIIIVWIVPILGAIGLWLLNRSHDEHVGADKWPFGGGSNDGGGISAGDGGGAGSDASGGGGD